MTRLIALVAGLCLLAMPLRAEVDIQQVESPGGIKAWLVEEPSIPFVALELRFRGGAALDRPEARGAVNLMTGLLEEGAADMDARAFAERQEELAASFSYRAYDDSIAVSARFLTENRDEAVALLRASLVEPLFTETALERVRGQVLSGLTSDQTDPEEIASRTFDEMAFGDHPYGTPVSGTLDSVRALTRADITAAHEGVLTRDRLYVGAVGDISAEELGPLLDDLLGDLPAEGRPMPPETQAKLPGGVKVVPFETPQSVAVFGHPGIPRDHPDFFAAYVMNQVLGAGGFESRLMEEVREKRGLTYGVYSWLVPKDLAPLYLGQVASANDRIAEAIAVIRDEWRRMAEEGVTEEELDAAVTYLTGAYPLRFDSNANIAEILVAMQMQGLDPSYVTERNDKIRAVTRDDVNRVARELLDPEGLQFIVVGQPEGLEGAPD